MRKLSKSDIREILKLWKSGMKVKDIMVKFGVCRAAIQYWIYPKMRERNREYIKKYFMPRYKKDKNFRLQHILSVKKYQNKPEIIIQKKKYDRKYRKMLKMKNHSYSQHIR